MRRREKKAPGGAPCVLFFDYSEFGELEQELLLPYAVEKDDGFAAVAVADDAENLACAEFGVGNSHTDLDGGNLLGCVGCNRTESLGRRRGTNGGAVLLWRLGDL